ncbi:unnamed protein product [Cladocopium goreaui]|uniref:Nipped-B-like protein B n=1 Tax=Cladocopium goreaui TaxID=2562237 RepID=A0A9P1DQH2_9DINO|nr:unnamed protein product [Cladocopium goreaui]
MQPQVLVSSHEKATETKLVFKHRPWGPSTALLRSGPRAQLRVRPKGDWAQRRLLCIAVCKGDANACPMAKLPQGFLPYFVNHVFSFLRPENSSQPNREG